MTDSEVRWSPLGCVGGIGGGSAGGCFTVSERLGGISFKDTH